jgi:hypothetical protein
MTEKTIRWYPTSMQLGKQTKEGLTPTVESLEHAFREVLRLHYELQDSHAVLQSQVKQGSSKEAVPAGNTAADQRFLGLPVQPSDTTQLADGTVLTYVAATRSFKFL